MKARYKNIFIKQGTVIENDVTKALINVLFKSLPKLTNSFMKFLQIKSKADKYYYDIQIPKSRSSNYDEIPNKFHLRIVDAWKEDKESIIDSDRKDSIADGVIYDQKNLVIIESKVRARKDDRQVETQCKQFNIPEQNRKERTWQDITELFRKEALNYKKSKNNKDIITYFILNEFLEYMEVINMSKFRGITFVEYEDNKREVSYDLEKAKNILRNLMFELNEEFKKNYKWDKRIYDQHVWDLFTNKKANKDKIHFSVYIYQDFCGIDCLIKADIFKRLWRAGKKNIVEILTNFCENIRKENEDDWFLEFTSYKLKNYKRGMQKGDRYTPFEIRINCLNVNKENIEQIISLLKNNKNKLSPWKEIKFIKRFDYQDKKYKYNNPEEMKNAFINAFIKLDKFHNKILKICKKEMIL